MAGAQRNRSTEGDADEVRRRWTEVAQAEPASALRLRDDPLVDQAMVTLSHRLEPLLDVYSQSLIDISRRQIVGYQDLDDRLVALLRASIDENLVAIVHFHRNGLDPDDVVAPPSALTYARRLAQRDVPLAALVRNYRIGQSAFTNLAFALITDPDGEIQRVLGDDKAGLERTTSALLAAHATVAIYIDEVTEQVTAAYEEERDRWVRRQGALVGHRVAAILNRELTPDAAQRGFEYDLSGTHLALVAWRPLGDGGLDALDADDLLRRCSRAAESTSRGLVTAADEREHWLWVPLGPTVEVEAAYQRVDDHSRELEVMVAIGAPAAGIEGFRIGHEQARKVRALLARSTVDDLYSATFAQLGPIAMLGDDPATLRAWVASTLGGLAAAGSREAELRETLLAYLENQGSFVATGDQLHLHRNSVAYRVQQAEKLRGRPLDDRLQLQLALVTCRWFGDAVLTS